MRILNEKMATEKDTTDILGYIRNKVEKWLQKHSKKIKPWRITLMVDLCFRKIADKKFEDKPHHIKGYVYRMEDVDYDEAHGYYAIIADDPLHVAKKRLTDSVIKNAYEYSEETIDLTFDAAAEFEHLINFEQFGKLDEAKKYSALFNVENGSGHTVNDWKAYIERAKIPGVKVITGESSYKHNKSVKIEVPNKDAAKKVISALRKYGLKWPDVDDFKMV